MINYHNELLCSFVGCNPGKESVMNQRQQGNPPHQGSFTGYNQIQYNAQNPGGYSYSPQNSGRQPVSAGYFQQNAYPTQGAGNVQAAPASANYYPQAGGYAQNPSGYTQQAGYPQQNGYSQPQGSSFYPQGGYPQNTGTGYSRPDLYQQGGYMPVNGSGQPAGVYPAAGMGSGYPQQPYTGSGGYPQQGGNVPETGSPYIPQTPYGNGYNGQGQSYTYPQQGYGAYQQMGRNAAGPNVQPMTDSARQIPLNGAGYVPQPVPVRKSPFRLTDTWLIIISVLLLILFAAGMFGPGLSALRWIFMVLAAGSIAALWVRPLTAGNKRLCYTLVFGVLCLVTAISMAAGAGGNSRNGGNAQRTDPPAVSQEASPTSNADLSGGVVLDGQSGQTISNIPAAAPTESPAPKDDNSAVERLQSFFYYWNANQIDEMLPLCSPSWQSGLESPRTSLFALMANRRPLELTSENITGTNDDDSRTVTISVLMDRNNNKDPVKYRMNVMMVKENGEWYVDPQSLKSNERETETPDVSASPSPSPEPATNAATVLYYNPEGGTKYHLDPNCKSTHEKYLPFKGPFTYGDLNNANYASLTPCNVCGAPLRPQ